MSETREEIHPSDAWERVKAKAAKGDLTLLESLGLQSKIARPYNPRMKPIERLFSHFEMK